MMERKHNTTGFTILELIIVIAIIGVLIAIFVISQTTARNKAHNATVLFQIEEYVKAIELYHTDVGIYPSGGVSDDAQRTIVYCIYDGHVSGQRCMPSSPSTLVPNHSPYPPGNSSVRIALKNYMTTLPKLDHLPGTAYASPAYSGCTYPASGGPQCDQTKDYSFWFLLKGQDQDCGRSTLVSGDVFGDGTTTLCRRESSTE
jgi:prepilin-type N-terminal cleavage/methylation domain-containing protein